jgi:hypothetical protein
MTQALGALAVDVDARYRLAIVAQTNATDIKLD